MDFALQLNTDVICSLLHDAKLTFLVALLWKRHFKAYSLILVNDHNYVSRLPHKETWMEITWIQPPVFIISGYFGKKEKWSRFGWSIVLLASKTSALTMTGNFLLMAITVTAFHIFSSCSHQPYNWLFSHSDFKNSMWWLFTNAFIKRANGGRYTHETFENWLNSNSFVDALDEKQDYICPICRSLEKNSPPPPNRRGRK